MKLIRLSQFKKGWFIGNFEPTLLKTEGFEVAIKHHKAGEDYERHYQKIATEYNVMISGLLSIDETLIDNGDIFIIYPNEIVKPFFHQDSVVVCIKVPSIQNDKVIVDDNPVSD